MPTLAPGWNLVPRWRTRMLPGMTISPPNFLTPSRRPAVSRPLRELPPAFLWAIPNSSALARLRLAARLGLGLGLGRPVFAGLGLGGGGCSRLGGGLLGCGRVLAGGGSLLRRRLLLCCRLPPLPCFRRQDGCRGGGRRCRLRHRGLARAPRRQDLADAQHR